MRTWMAAAALAIVATQAGALERKPFADVDTDALTRQTQVSSSDSVEQHLGLVWWIPQEFWRTVLANDMNTSEADKQVVLDAFSGVFVLALVQADISALGAFHFYTREEVAAGLDVQARSTGADAVFLAPMGQVKPDLELVLGFMKPMLTAAMGNLGNNMHFFVYEDAGAGGARRIDPYEPGEVAVTLRTRDGRDYDSLLELPLDALYVPRTCPNGKAAHVSWRFCPWSGAPLPE